MDTNVSYKQVEAERNVSTKDTTLPQKRQQF